MEDYTTETPAKADTTGEADSSTTPSGTTDNVYPCHPPFNWEMVRRRRDHGRYILDIQAAEEQRLCQIKTCLQEEGSQSSPSSSRVVSLVHPKGVDWDLLRKDVAEMCDSAIKRNPDEVGDGKTGSLSYAVKKIKGVSFEFVGWRISCSACRHIIF